MKYLAIITIALMTTLQGMSQNANAIFFSDDGMKMIVIMNGLRQNDEAQTNVKIEDLSAGKYDVKVIFEGNNKVYADSKIRLKPNTESTFVVKEKSAAEQKFNRVTKMVAEDLNITKEELADDAQPLYKVADFSETSIRGASPGKFSSAESISNSQTNASTTTSARASTSAEEQRVEAQTASGSTDASVEAQTAGQAGGSVSAQGNGAHISMNINLNGTSGQATSTTTTTTTTQQQDHYVMQGYNGPIGCPWPMSEGDFQSAMRSIQSKSFEDSKLTMAKQIINSNCLFSSQVRDMMNSFSFEDTRLELAKYAYGYTYDIGNYYKVNDAFDFESSIDELNEYISGQ